MDSTSASMDGLIKTINRLQDAFATVGVANPIDLPQITVVGSQSSGKSSVLENIVGKDFLPRGSGIVTRRPLVLQLISRPAPKDKDGKDDTKEPIEWGEFLHKPGVKFTDFNKIRDEIVADTELKTGKNKGISNLPINLRVFSPNVLTLTLIDLPGLTKVPVGDQPRDIEKQIRDMLLRYITKPNAIILAVTGANTDLANSDGLQLAREVDPEGVRTIGVLTKIDLMDKGTDVVDILAGRVIPLRLGYVPVVNRGQRDVDAKRPVKEALDAERLFFEQHPSYQSKAKYCGTPFLARKLSMILMRHIRNTLPEIKSKINSSLTKYKTELAALGNVLPNASSQNILLSLITEFCSEFRTLLDGNAQDVSTQELSGGARISFVFHEIFAQAVASMDPFDQIKEADIRTILYNSSGSSPALFVATTAFEVLIKQQIKRLEEPSLKCISMVYDELIRILQQILQKPIFKRYPALKEKFYGTVTNFYRQGVEPTNKFVKDLVAAEATYINTAHPDFVNGHKAMGIVNDKLQLNTRGPVGPDGKRKPNGTSATNQSPSHMVKSTSSDKVDDGGGFFGSFFSSKAKRRPGVLEQAPAVLKATGTVNEREFMEIEIIKILLQSYYSIVKRTVIDMVPKACMLHLVTFAREGMQTGLLSELYTKDETLDELLKESEVTVERRKECQKMITALQKADEIVASV